MATSSVQCDGFDADGFSSSGQSVALTVNAGGTVEVGIAINGPGNSSVINNGTIDGYITADGDGDFTIVQNGALNGGAITVTNGTGTNSLTVTAKHSVNAVEMQGASNIVVMDGSTNSAVTLEAPRPISAGTSPSTPAGLRWRWWGRDQRRVRRLCAGELPARRLGRGAGGLWREPRTALHVVASFA